MLRAEQLMNTNPDSAAQMLASLQEDVPQMKKSVRIYYDLLCVKVKDKCYIPHTSDSVLRRVVRYYEKGNDRDKLMEAYYYMGRVYWDMNDMPRALEYYQKAVDVSEKTVDYYVLGRIYNQMGSLYAYQNVYDEALPLHRQSYSYLQLAGDSLALPYIIRDMARIYGKTEQKDSAVIYYQQAMDLALTVGSKMAVKDISSELGGVYADLGEYSLATKYLYQSLKSPATRDSCFSFVSLGYLYLQTDQTDSAYFYLDKCVSTTNINTLSMTYKYLSLLEENNSNYEKSVLYNHLHNQWQDSITKITNTEAIRKMHSLYNYQIAENKSNRLSTENRQKRLLIQQLALLLVIILAGGAIYLQLESNKKKALRRMRQLQDELKEKQYKKSLAYIRANERKIEELEMLLHSAEQEKNEVQVGLIQAQKELLEVTNRKIISEKKEQSCMVESFKQSEVYCLFHNPSNMDVNKVTDGDWASLQKELNRVYDNFTNRLYALYPQLSIVELQICCLLKISVSVTNMAKLTGRSKSAITAARIRLHFKLRGEEGTADKLDAFIIDL